MSSSGKLLIFGGRGILGQSKLKVPSSDQIFIGRGREAGVVLGYSKLKMPISDQIFIFGGRGHSWLLKTQSAKFRPNFHFLGAGRGRRVILANQELVLLTK